MLRIDISSDGQFTTIHLIGRLREEHIEELTLEIRKHNPPVELDMGEVDLVDVEVVRFLGICRSQGVRLLGCSQYIADWIDKELS